MMNRIVMAVAACMAAELACAQGAIPLAVSSGPGASGGKSPAQRQSPIDARMRTVIYSADAVVQVPVMRGMVTHIVLNDDEELSLPPATGMGSDCARETDTWCIAATGRDIFVKPKTGASKNNMVLVTSQRRHAFEMTVQPEGNMATTVMRLAVKVPKPAPAPIAAAVAAPVLALSQLPPPPPALSPAQLVANRMHVMPIVRNSDYSVATGPDAEAIVPTLVFDDGTHTFFQFPSNRPMPALFQTGADKSEELVNVRVQDDMVVADRVAPRFVLRLGDSVVAIINEAFDPNGTAPKEGTLVPGVKRVVRDNVASAPQAQQNNEGGAR